MQAQSTPKSGCAHVATNTFTHPEEKYSMIVHWFDSEGKDLGGRGGTRISFVSSILLQLVS